jgi:PAS domain S-box-containing protein
MTPSATPPGDAVRGAAVAGWATPLALVLVLLVANSYNHALFHTLAELFAVMVALLVAVVGWQAFPFSRNDFLLYLAAGYFWVGALDLAHALTYEGIRVVPFESADASIQFWVGTRYLEAFILLTAPLALVRPAPWRTTFAVLGGFAAILAFAIAVGRFPTAYVPGVGLTPFKVVSEYVIVGLLCAALAHVWYRRAALDGRLVRLMAWSIVFTMAAELLLTLYVAFGELPTVIAHILKFVSYWFIYVGAIATMLTDPFRTLARGANTFDAVPEATVVVDEQGLIRQANGAARRLLRTDDLKLIGRHCHPLLHDARILREQCPICRAIADGTPLDEQEVEVAALDQSHQVSLSPIEARGVTVGMVHVSVDITQRVLAARALRESEARFRGLVESTNDWVWEVDEELTFTYASPQVSTLLGYSPEEMVGRAPTDFMPAAEAERIKAICAQAVVARSCVKGLENINFHKDGHPVVIETNGAPFFDEAGGFRGFRGINRDVSDRKGIEQELERHRNRLEYLVEARTAALEAANSELEAFTYSVSHDLRAPLRAIDGFSQVLVNRYADQLDGQARDYLERVRRGSQRMGELIDGLLGLSRIHWHEIRREEVDLSAMAQDVVRELRGGEPQRQATVEIAPGLRADCDPRLARVVLDNLIGNAWKYSRRRADARICIAAAPVNGRDGFVVRDNGAGFDMQYADKLFAPFQRLHQASEFEGSGIGLASVRRAVERHGGAVRAESVVGEGAAFYFHFGGAA